MKDSAQELIRHTKVHRVTALSPGKPTVVRASASLREAALAAVQSPATRVLAVVDEEERLVGVLSLGSLCEDIFVHIVPEDFLANSMDMETALEFARAESARRVSDIMDEPVAVRGEQTVKDALDLLHRHGLGGLPVVDEAGKVTGYLDLAGLLSLWLQASGTTPA